MKICVKARILVRRVLRRLGFVRARPEPIQPWVDLAIAYAKNDDSAMGQIMYDMAQKYLDEGGTVEEAKEPGSC